MDSDGSPTVALTVASAAWRNAFEGRTGEALEPLAERIVRATLDRAAVTPWLKGGEVSLLLTDDREVRSLNATYRERDRPTNVLSFPGLDLLEGEAREGAPPGPVLLGDIAISIDRVLAEAEDLGKTAFDHFAHLLVHGSLHLLGFDHGDDRAAEVMEGLETEILKELGIAAPYDQTAGPGESDRPASSVAVMSVQP
ncbi:MAG: rRNA maturation RNase YbeY [Pseudomonadota bacterium]